MLYGGSRSLLPLAVQASVLGEWGYSALFVVSGYVLSYGKAELSIQMARRYVRLYFPMYTACAFAWLLQCYTYSEADLGTRMGWFAEIGHLHVFVPGWYPNLVTWTMPYELYAPLVVTVLKGARGRLGTKWVLTMMVLIAISDTTFNGIMFGSMACVLGTQTEEKLHTWVLALVGFCAMVVYVPTSNASDVGVPQASDLRNTFLPLGISCWIMCACRVQDQAPVWMAWVSCEGARLTFGIYLLHVPLLEVVRKATGMASCRPGVPSYVKGDTSCGVPDTATRWTAYVFVFWPVLLGLSVAFCLLVDEPLMRYVCKERWSNGTVRGIESVYKFKGKICDRIILMYTTILPSRAPSRPPTARSNTLYI
jgi:hypothetical protein